MQVHVILSKRSVNDGPLDESKKFVFCHTQSIISSASSPIIERIRFKSNGSGKKNLKKNSEENLIDPYNIGNINAERIVLTICIMVSCEQPSACPILLSL
ncbi:hypothetical protein DERF_012088 [Dermatophagoides farinae]|uniref:Uncharacterized protein n=1 Tax=Dermatophagoides farinae TaxID=6954 RepID=A0A922KXT7_DERFA|nr:hypothetical protein DERF_012088 [Dermatophagoides farinae]